MSDGEHSYDVNSSLRRRSGSKPWMPCFPQIRRADWHVYNSRGDALGLVRFLRLAGLLGQAAGTAEELGEELRWDKRHKSGDRYQSDTQQNNYRSHDQKNDRQGSDRQGGGGNSGAGRDQWNKRSGKSRRSTNSGWSSSSGVCKKKMFASCLVMMTRCQTHQAVFFALTQDQAAILQHVPYYRMAVKVFWLPFMTRLLMFLLFMISRLFRIQEPEPISKAPNRWHRVELKGVEGSVTGNCWSIGCIRSSDIAMGVTPLYLWDLMKTVFFMKFFGNVSHCVHLDVILVCLSPKEEHEDHLRTVLQILRHENFMPIFQSANFCVGKVAFLGHIVSAVGITMDQAKVEAISPNGQGPTSLIEVRSFLGLAGYYRRFVEGFFRLALPLTKLMRKGEKFVWNEEREKSFEELKQRLVSSPILTLPSGSGGFQIYSDASKKGLGCVLMQHGKVIAYASRNTKALRALCLKLLRIMTQHTVPSGKANVVADALSRESRGIDSWYQSGKKGIIRALRIKTAQKDDGEIWAIIQNIDQQTEFRVDDDGILWQGSTKMYHRLNATLWWSGLQKAWGTRLKFSTAFHPETDGQSERTIQTLEDMLRSCALEWAGNWDDYICLVEFAYNNSWRFASIKLRPIEMCMVGNVVAFFMEKLKEAQDSSEELRR
ncbi:retrotransposon protein, putative, ty3-gypsy subclass [Tanacetum coccineum]